jgi:hypothetical protein
MIVATFPRESDADDYRKALRDAHAIGDVATSTATIAARGEPWHGHQVVASWVRREIESDVRALAQTHGGVVHDVSGAVIIPLWVRDLMAARERATDPLDGR